MKKIVIAVAIAVIAIVSFGAHAAQCQPESVCVVGQGCYIVTVCR